MKNVLITGANGQLGTELGKIMPAAVLATHSDLDITNKRAVDDFVRKNNIKTIVNCAAYTAVDAAEDDAETAYKINALAPGYLAQTGCQIIHVSTDYVFDGNLLVGAYQTTDTPRPISVYGKSKWNGELAVLNKSKNRIIIRTSWLYSPYGKNFVKTMRKLGATRDEISVVSDQYGLPTYAKDLAVAIVQIIPQMTPEKNGIYHYSNLDTLTGTLFKGISWYDFAVEIMKQSNLNCAVKPISTAEYPTRAVRPKYSVLDTTTIEQTFGIKIPTWRDALKRCLGEMQR
jgi:dTDP-4-dehydrorhamnose reductase